MRLCFVAIFALFGLCWSQPLDIQPMPAGTGAGNMLTGGTIRTKEFTEDEITAMIDGMNSGLFYNYQGQVVPVTNPLRLTMEQLLDLLSQIRAKGMGARVRTAEFNEAQVRAMIAGMRAGKFYNYQGQEVPRTNAEKLTPAQLVELLNRILAQGSVRTTAFYEAHIRAMIAGMTKGKFYDYQGQEVPESHAEKLTWTQLNQLFNQILAQARRTATFNEAQVRVMIEGMNAGKFYNYQGQEVAASAPQRLTLGQLNQLLTQLIAQGRQRTAEFNEAQVRAMIAGMNAGKFYNYQGQEVAAAYPQKLTMEQLNRLLSQIVSRGPMKTAEFTLDQILAMIAGMNAGKFYNYQGQEVQASATQKLTLQQLEQLRSQLVARGPMKTAEFTLADVNRMLAGMDQGFFYDFMGNQVLDTAPQKLTRAQLDRLLAQLKAQAPVNIADLGETEIRKMISDLEQGRVLEFQDISLEQLNQLLNQITSSGPMKTAEFTLGQVQTMLDGMSRGLWYDYQGNEVPATHSQRLTLEQLNTLLLQLQQQVGPATTAEFTLGQIQAMLEGMQRGLWYDYQGNEVPATHNQRLTEEQLNTLLLQLQQQGAGEVVFTLPDVEKMLEGMNKFGRVYNFQGREAKPGERTLTLEQLNNFQRQLSQTGMVETAEFTLADVMRMLEGARNNIRYNYQGQEAGPNEPALTQEQLNQLYEQLKPAETVDPGVSGQDVAGNLLDPLPGTRASGSVAAATVDVGTRSEAGGIVDASTEGGAGTDGSVDGGQPVDFAAGGNVDVSGGTVDFGATGGTVNFETTGATGGAIDVEATGGAVDFGATGATGGAVDFGATGGTVDFGATGGNVDAGQPADTGAGGGISMVETGPSSDVGASGTVDIGQPSETGGSISMVETGPPADVGASATVDIGQPVDVGASGGVSGDTSAQGGVDMWSAGSVSGDAGSPSGSVSIDVGSPSGSVSIDAGSPSGSASIDAGTASGSVGVDAGAGVGLDVSGGEGAALVVDPRTAAENAANMLGDMMSGRGDAGSASNVVDFNPVAAGDAGADATGTVSVGDQGGASASVGLESGPRPFTDVTIDASPAEATGGMGGESVSVDGGAGIGMGGSAATGAGGQGTGSLSFRGGSVSFTGEGTGTGDQGTGGSGSLSFRGGSLNVARDGAGTEEGGVGGTGSLSLRGGSINVARDGAGTGEGGVGGSGSLSFRGGSINVARDGAGTGEGGVGGTGSLSFRGGSINVARDGAGTDEGGVGGSGSLSFRRGSIKVTGQGAGTSRIIGGGAATGEIGGGESGGGAAGGIGGSASLSVGGRSGSIMGGGSATGGMGGGASLSVGGGTGSISRGGSATATITGGVGRGVAAGTAGGATGMSWTTRAGAGGFNPNVIDSSNFIIENQQIDEALTGGAFGGGPFLKNGSFIGVIEQEWRKARVDPAVCRANGCTGPICYLPYANDCKNYIVCQRTAIGTYVAWKMRCAFGSYWREGSAWTCERVEDLLNAGYVCPNDPCAGGTLQRYADEDEKNCRTYWKCVNGVSEPVCCPAGSRFDRTRLECVPDFTETCRAPCPLKIEGCSIPGERTQPFYDGNCKTYWDCENGHPHPVCCNEGMYFNVLKKDCDVDVEGKCRDKCPAEYLTNNCAAVVNSSMAIAYPSYPLYDGNCRSYMKCNPGGFDEAFCCKQKYRYEVSLKTCVPIEDPLDPCNEEMCPTGYKEECRFSPVPGKPNKFQDKSINIEFDCAPGTYFDAPICTCNGHQLAESEYQLCNDKETWVKFDHPEDIWTIRNHGGSGSVSPFGSLKKNVTDEGITYGTFNGASGLQVWPYTQTVFPAVNMRINFQPVSGGGKDQVLVSNCRSSAGKTPSFVVYLRPASGTIEFRGTTENEQRTLQVPYNKQGWNQLSLIFDGENVLLINEDAAGLGETFMKWAPLSGSILASEKSLRFGPCTDDMPVDNGFTGFMSELTFAKCLNKATKEYFDTQIATMPAGNNINNI